MKETKAKLKQAGLDAAEEQTRLAFEHLKKMGKILVEGSDNEFDDVAFNGLLMFEGKFQEVHRQN